MNLTLPTLPIKWLYSLAGKLFIVVPGATTLVILSTLLSQVSLIIAFFLPLKVLILLGSTGMPRYFPQSWQAFERDELAVVLSLAAAFFYILYLLSERLIKIFSELGAARLITKTEKLMLFSNQGEMAVHAYQRFSRGASSLVFAFLSIVTVLIIYQSLGMLVIGYIAISSVLLFSLAQKTSGDTDNSYLAYTGILSAIGFLLAFAYMVGDFIIGQQPNMIVAVICMLLVRQLLNRLASVSIDFTYIYDQKEKITALFFHGQKLLPGLSNKEKDYENLLLLSNRESWIKSVLNEVAGLDIPSLKSSWLQHRLPNVTSYLVSLDNIQGSGYLVKIYNKNRKNMAVHESALFGNRDFARFPGMHFLGSSSVEGFNCNIFKYDNVWTRVEKKELRHYRALGAASLMAIKPDVQLIKSYQRSHPMLDDRLNTNLINTIKSIYGERDDLDKLEKNIAAIINLIDRLPLQIVNPDIRFDMLQHDQNNNVCYLHWGRWKLEPAGAGWPVIDNKPYKIEEYISEALQHRDELNELPLDYYILSALIYAFEDFSNRKLYTSAIELIPAILAVKDKIDEE